METSHLLDVELKALVTIMLNELRAGVSNSFSPGPRQP